MHTLVEERELALRPRGSQTSARGRSPALPRLPMRGGRRLKVALVARGGLETQPNVYVPANYLARCGAQVSLVAPSCEPEPAFELHKRVRYVPLAPRRGRGEMTQSAGSRLAKVVAQLRDGLLLGRHLRREKYDVIHVTNPWSVPACAIARVFSRGAKVVYHSFDHLEPRRFYYQSRLEGWFARRCDLVVDVEPNRARYLKCAYRLKRLPLAVRNALPRDWPIPPRDESLRRVLLGPQPPDDAVLVIYQGFLGAERFTDVLARAMALLPPRYRLALCGSWESDAFRRRVFAAAGDAAGRIHYAGCVPHRELLRYTVCADVGVMLYFDDDYASYFCSPNKLTEFAACGVPMVGPDYLGIERLIEGHGLGRTAPPREPKAIAQAVRRIVEEPPGLHARRLHVRRMFEQRLAFEHEGARLAAAYCEMLSAADGSQREAERACAASSER